MGANEQLLKKRKQFIRAQQRAKQAQTNRRHQADQYKVDVTKLVDTSGYSECYIVGGGPSLKGFNWSLLNNKFVIAINRAYEVLPNAQIIYFTDKDFWQRHQTAMLNHGGRLFRGTLRLGDTHNQHVTEWFLSGEHGLETRSGYLKHGKNSTYAAVNLAAVHLGFKKIYLLGIDMKWGTIHKKSTSHWHDGHKRIDNEKIYPKMTANFNQLAPLLTERGVKVINVSVSTKTTNLKIFPIQTFQQVFGQQDDKGDNNEA